MNRHMEEDLKENRREILPYPEENFFVEFQPL
jgi:hypothetical protein